MIRAMILGCGSSGGVPRLGNRWGDCDPTNPKNRRRRCSILIEKVGPDGVTSVLVDTGPDLVPQLLDAGVGALDGVIYTHEHADHIHGIDDLRQIAHNMRRRVQVWASVPTAEALQDRFGYIFKTPEGSFYPPICDLHLTTSPTRIDGAGGPLVFQPFTVNHGDIAALGLRVGGLVYLPDVSDIPDEAWPLIEQSDVFICDALRIEPHVSHAHLAKSLDWIARSRCQLGVVTNMHIDLDYQWVMSNTPGNVVPAFDGMVITLTDDASIGISEGYAA